MKCIIVDDEPLARQGMEKLIANQPALQLAGSFKNAAEAGNFLLQEPIDLIFLDIKMPGINGMEFASTLPPNCLVIFTTAFEHYALKSYEVEAIDYLLKPIQEHRFDKAVQKAITMHKILNDQFPKPEISRIGNDHLFIKADRRTHKVYFQDISYIEGLKDYVIIYMTEDKLITLMNLKQIHSKLPQKLFLRVGKSYLVNAAKISSFDLHTVYLGTKEIPLGEVYREAFYRDFVY